jgi:hypothetical protein
MNRRSLVVVALLALSVLATSLPAHAQSSDAKVGTTIPFGFVVGDTSLPAGEYRIVHQTHQMPALRIQSADGKVNMGLNPVERLARQHMGDAPAAGSLVFDKVGDKHYLSEVWMPGEDGYLLPPTKEAHLNEVHEIVDVK